MHSTVNNIGLIDEKSSYDKITVSICCLTYNHASFIKDAIEGFLMQKTTFPFEIIIHDDASTDGTDKIIREYGNRYPDKIIPIIQRKNQYYDIKGSMIAQILLPSVRGKYIATCEGDDYWTDPLKLQKQVDFLEENPDYSLSVGGYIKLDVNTQKTSTIISRIIENDPGRNGYSFTLKEMRRVWITKTLTAVYRRDLYVEIDFSVYKSVRDIHTFYHLIKEHKGFYFAEDFGVYRIHEGGVNSMKHGKVNHNAAYNCYKELFEQNKDEFTRVMYRFNTLGLLNFNLYHRYPENNFRKNINLYFEAVKLTRSFYELRFLLTTFLPQRLKAS